MMLKLIKIPSLSDFRVSLLAISSLLVLNACGGGLGGSGDGGDDISKLIPVPETFDQPYLFRTVPERMIANFPYSLANDTPVTLGAASPYGQLTTTFSKLTEQKLEIALLQLHLETNWDHIVAHCENTPFDTPCDLTDAGISSQYTSSMASWEYLRRASIEAEMLGGIDILTDAKLSQIEDSVSQKIGSKLNINNGTYTRVSTGSYQNEIAITDDFGFGSAIYTARWSDDKALTFLSLVEVEDGGATNLQSTTNSGEAVEGFSNAILATDYVEDTRQEIQLNLNQPDSSGGLQIESQLTEIADGSRTDVYSIGKADSTGGYISSQTSVIDASDNKMSEFIRESFNEEAEVDSRAVCNSSQSEIACDADNQWTVQTAQDPVTSSFFLTPLQLASLEKKLVPFDLSFSGVSPVYDTLILISRENLTISFSNNGLVLSIPGLGVIDFTGNTVATEEGVDTNDLSNFTNLADSVLCRSNKAIVDNTVSYRSFCAATSEEIENALVIGESFSQGQLVIEWQANAVVQVLEN